MTTTNDYDDLDFSDDPYADRPKRRAGKPRRGKGIKKFSFEFDDNVDFDDYDLYDKWDDDPTSDFRTIDYD